MIWKHPVLECKDSLLTHHQNLLTVVHQSINFKTSLLSQSRTNLTHQGLEAESGRWPRWHLQFPWFLPKPCSCWLEERDRVNRTTSILLALLDRNWCHINAINAVKKMLVTRDSHVLTNICGPVHLKTNGAWLHMSTLEIVRSHQFRRSSYTGPTMLELSCQKHLHLTQLQNGPSLAEDVPNLNISTPPRKGYKWNFSAWCLINIVSSSCENLHPNMCWSCAGEQVVATSRKHQRHQPDTGMPLYT